MKKGPYKFLFPYCAVLLSGILVSLAYAGARNVQGLLLPGDSTIRMAWGGASTTQASHTTIYVDGSGDVFAIPDGGAAVQMNASGGGETLAQTLALGNSTGGTDVVVTAADGIGLGGATTPASDVISWGTSGAGDAALGRSSANVLQVSDGAGADAYMRAAGINFGSAAQVANTLRSGSSIDLVTQNGAVTVTTVNGDVTVTASDGDAAEVGHAIGMTAGDGGLTSGNGGAITLTAGNALANNDDGGSINLSPGSPNGSGVAGSVILTDGLLTLGTRDTSGIGINQGAGVDLEFTDGAGAVRDIQLRPALVIDSDDDVRLGKNIGIAIASDLQVDFSSSTASGGTPDCGFERDAANVVGFTDGSTGTGQVFAEAYQLESLATNPGTPSAGRGIAFVTSVDLLCHIDDGGTTHVLLGAFLHYQDQKSQGTEGGTFTSGAWQTRVLNTEVTDTHSLGTVSSNQIRLEAGTYEVDAWAKAFNVNRHQLRLRNTTPFPETTLLTGLSNDCTTNVTTTAQLRGRITLTAQSVLELQHQCSQTQATNGFGLACNFTTEVFSDVTFRLVAQ